MMLKIKVSVFYILLFPKTILVGLLITLVGCQTNKESKFRLLNGEKTGLAFSNTVKPSPELNIFNYMYFYNGGGIGAADFNKDGFVDLVFTANQSDNKLYLNKGKDKKLQFEDITEKAGFKAPAGWSTGISIVDINQDGLLDIYISRVGDFSVLKGHNLLFVCQNIDPEGIPHFSEKSKEYGLDLVGFGTQAAFFDADADGDLDLFQLNHSVHQNGTFGKRDLFLNSFHPLSGDRFFENRNRKYVETTQKVGINSSVLGYGLGIALGDVNLDGYPDVYVGNDFHENDYLYVNQKNGTFRDEMNERIRHTSRFTMGVEIADLNNDVFPEILTLDMLPYDPEILKRSEGEDAYYNFKFKLAQGYNVQFARNNLQLNNREGVFSEIGMAAGIHATDWSWSALIFDFENDGRKDIFISNGINKRMNDMDYINFVSTDEIQQQISEKRFDESNAALTNLLPEVKIPNRFFKNTPDLLFEDQADFIDNNADSYSNGAVYADLDNDGDLDIVTNNINASVFVYENLSQQTPNSENKSLKINLKGKQGNVNAIGAKCLVYSKGDVRYQEKFPVRGFQSSAEIPLLIGLGKVEKVDSVVVIWPTNEYETLKNIDLKKTLSVNYKPNLPIYDYQRWHIQKGRFKDQAAWIGLDILHQENQFNEFDREALIPNMMSTEGPALAVGDFNGDGLEDVFMGASRGIAPQIYIQKSNGKFVPLPQSALIKDADFEDVDAVWVDVNNDKNMDLIVGSGGNEYYGKSEFLQTRLYLNDGKGQLQKDTLAFKGFFINAQAVRVADVNQDGFADVFIGARSVPFAYGKTPDSYLFINDGKGHFNDQTELFAPDLKKGGLVKDAQWVDLDADKDLDLVVAYEWGKVVLFENNSMKFTPKPLTDKKGWWNFVQPIDIDQDGDLDLICGNVGLNSRLHASDKEPVRMYVNDYDENGRLDQIITYYLLGKETIFPDKRELERQIPYIKKQFLQSRDFAKASLSEIVGSKKLTEAQVLEANYFENAWLENRGKDGFVLRTLGSNAQYTSYYAAEAINNPLTKKTDIMLLGNFFDCNIQMGLYDADNGSVFSLNGKGQFLPHPLLDTPLGGQVRRIRKIKIGKSFFYLVARNNEKLMALEPN
ncbi:VCBS repeat-containing protein [Runella sp. CRIBMP]|uniref:VCBS repeat-containing protein n=1 Tax=Runella sp. CRIBMP TaxID=2683261 RepID=UPI001E4A1F95|nr:VCBS repeat-containing protein [Runella sp. CRIBMP]